MLFDYIKFQSLQFCQLSVDVQYNYTRAWGDSTSIFTVGVIDMTNEDVPLFRRDAYHTSMFDPRGRRWYARVLWQF